MPASPLYRGLFLWCLDRAGFGRSEPGEREKWKRARNYGKVGFPIVLRTPSHSHFPSPSPKKALWRREDAGSGT